MEAAPSLLPHELTRYAYRAHQAAIRIPLAAAHLGLRPFAKRRGTQPQAADMKALQRELAALLERDALSAPPFLQHQFGPRIARSGVHIDQEGD